MPEKVYRQKYVVCTYNGVLLQGQGEGGSYVVRHRGGEVELTEGTDGGDINLAADQGIQIDITFRETADAHEFLWNMHRSQGNGAPGATLAIITGTGRTLTAPDCFVSMPGELATGDKRQGSHTYTFLSNRPSFY
ncbi:MAG: hypothetical protein LBU64_06445 [Planctomycetota bacterium]|jgi:hypothetical protein|nr:hypothetical protein [Planctomycetota bacterium]